MFGTEAEKCGVSFGEKESSSCHSIDEMSTNVNILKVLIRFPSFRRWLVTHRTNHFLSLGSEKLRFTIMSTTVSSVSFTMLSGIT